MTDLEMLVLLGNVKGKYILQAQALRSRKPQARHFGLRRAVTLAAAILTLMILLCGTAMAVSEDFRNYVLDVIGILFPPKTETVMIEGMAEEIRYVPFGEIPAGSAPSFAIYSDSEGYVMTKEDGIYYVRPLFSGDVQLPPCEMTIAHCDENWEALCTQTRSALLPLWETVSEAKLLQDPERLAFTAWTGREWNSPIAAHYFLSDGEDGCYHITARYFLEASEGHGVRFAAMAASFRLLRDWAAEPEGIAAREEVVALAGDFAEAYFNRDAKTLRSFLAEGESADAVFSGGKVSELLVKQIVGAVGSGLGDTYVVSLEFRASDQPDRLQYLTMEIVRREDGWKVASYGLEG